VQNILLLTSDYFKTLIRRYFMRSLKLQKLFSTTVLSKNINQAHELAKYAINFMENGQPSAKVLERSKMFHTDSVICGLSALALKTNAPHVLRDEALEFSLGKNPKIEAAKVFGSEELVPIEKAIAANSSAVREWDSNGTVFGYANHPTRQAG
jgi:2-methylcitrate dehydratase